jgi:hypothetical protein
MFTSVWLFRRVNGNWTAVRKLVSEHDYQYNIWPDGLATSVSAHGIRCAWRRWAHSSAVT